jgi:hypothetical protein
LRWQFGLSASTAAVAARVGLVDSMGWRGCRLRGSRVRDEGDCQRSAVGLCSFLDLGRGLWDVGRLGVAARVGGMVKGAHLGGCGGVFRDEDGRGDFPKVVVGLRVKGTARKVLLLEPKCGGGGID